MRRLYVVLFSIMRPLAAVLYPMKVERRGEPPQGPAIVCANHSNNIDPILLAIAFGIRAHFLHFMVKIELIKKPVIGIIMRKIGCFPADRSFGMEAVRTAIKLLKSGEKVMIFPEGTRVPTDDSIAAKTGAVRLAVKMGVPLAPVYIPRRKFIFRRVKLVIGEPYTIEKKEGLDYEELARELMDRIRELGPENATNEN